MQPFQVPGDANQVPFALHGLEATQQELAEAHDRFDDAEDRFHRALAFGIELLPGTGSEPVLHPGDCIGIRRRQRFPEAIHERLVVLIPAKSDIRRDAFLLAGPDVRFAVEAVIADDRFYRSECVG